MNFKFVVIVNLFLLLGMSFSAYAKNIPPKLKPEKFIDNSAYSTKTSKFLDNLTKNKKKEQPILKSKEEVLIQEEKNQKKEEPKKEVKDVKEKKYLKKNKKYLSLKKQKKLKKRISKKLMVLKTWFPRQNLVTLKFLHPNLRVL